MTGLQVLGLIAAGVLLAVVLLVTVAVVGELLDALPPPPTDMSDVP